MACGTEVCRLLVAAALLVAGLYPMVVYRPWRRVLAAVVLLSLGATALLLAGVPPACVAALLVVAVLCPLWLYGEHTAFRGD